MEKSLVSSPASSCITNPRTNVSLATQGLNLEAWYLGESQKDSPTENIQRAFDRAKQFHEATFKGRNANQSWLSTASSMSDVLAVLYESQNRYDKIAACKSKKVTLNQEELSLKIAQAVAEIGSVLPEVNFVACQLYPVQAIQQTLADAYTHIVAFCIQATKWYHDVSRNRARKLWHAIANPWPLEFQDTRIAIDTCFRRLREQSALAHQTETRAIHAKVCEVLAISTHGHPSLCQPDLGYDASKTTVYMEDTGSSDDVRIVINLESVSVFFDSIPIDASRAVKTGLVTRDRRRTRGSELLGAIWDKPALHKWISSPKSAILRVDSPFARQDAALDFALDIIEMARLAKIRLVLYLGVDINKGPVLISDVLRSLTLQIIEQNPDILAKARIQHEQFKNSENVDDWLQLLVALASSLPRLVLVLDAQENSTAILDVVSGLKEGLDARKADVSLKVMILTRQMSEDTASALLTPWAGCSGQLVVCNSRGLDRRPVRYSSRGPPRGSKSSDEGPDQAKRLLLAAWS
ncbi:hypothetical protein INS49_008196 [Diaporthe citri]|uniref:uncharacterized protein n=1 Tax=Diaporthe citri TaxID=83186 RepID=UPI001C7EF383|nr:uncharacterized protein INS49_008196 [Diaporthe citri]KAG6363101.1 hypothetical protein INS49_008196 [Diaporthe citri]